MAIDRIRSDHYRIPLPVVLSDSTHKEITHFELITARISMADGAEGLGYTYTVGRGGGSVRALIDELADVLAGADETRIEALWKEMWWALHWIGRGGSAAFAISAVDVALWDVMGKRAGLPLWRLLGGADPTVAVYAGGIDLYFTLDALLEQTRGNLEAGFEAIKMKIGRQNLREDVERVAAMRDYLGDGFALMADANMGWDRPKAIAAAKALAPYGLVWIEEPLEIMTRSPISTASDLSAVSSFPCRTSMDTDCPSIAMASALSAPAFRAALSIAWVRSDRFSAMGPPGLC